VRRPLRWVFVDKIQADFKFNKMGETALHGNFA